MRHLRLDHATNWSTWDRNEPEVPKVKTGKPPQTQDLETQEYTPPDDVTLVARLDNSIDYADPQRYNVVTMKNE